MLEAIRYRNGNLEILNQLLLPLETQYECINGVQDGWQAIFQMKVRGAPAIAIVGALSLVVELQKSEFQSNQSLLDFVVAQLEYLVTARPTAVNIKQVADRLTLLAQDRLQKCAKVEDMKARIIKEAESIMYEDVAINQSIGAHGAQNIAEYCQTPIRILTHCNTGSLATAGYGTALGVIRKLYEQGSLDHVYCTETRPFNQGSRLTTYELLHDQIPFHLICDSMVASLMQRDRVSAVVVGADRVVANGDTANKIGTYQIAVCAKHHNVPFYVASPLSTIDTKMKSGAEIPIEERPAREMTHIQNVRITPEGVNCWNPSFDITPAELITGGIITELGVFPAADLGRVLVLKNLTT